MTLKLVSSVILTNYKFDKYLYEMSFGCFALLSRQDGKMTRRFLCFIFTWKCVSFLKFSTFHGQIEIEQKVFNVYSTVLCKVFIIWSIYFTKYFLFLFSVYDVWRGVEGEGCGRIRPGGRQEPLPEDHWPRNSGWHHLRRWARKTIRNCSKSNQFCSLLRFLTSYCILLDFLNHPTAS